MSKKIIFYILGILLLIGLGIGIYYYFNKNDINTINIDKIIAENTFSVIDEDSDIDWTNYKQENITLNDKSITIDSEGIYTINGKISNGSITINTDGNVKLILNNVEVTNNSGPAIIIDNAKNTIIELADNSVNTLIDGESYTNEEYDGCIYSADDLILTGNGKLIIKANYQDGIVSKDDLKIVSGNYEITAKDDAVRGKDSVYIVNGKFDITSTGDGIKTTNDTDTDKGNIKIDNGTFKIKSSGDAIQAENKLVIENGTFEITTATGATINETGKQFFNQKTTTNDTSAKGIKAGNNLIIYNGTFNINSSDDSIHTNGDLTITNGTFNLKSSDDAVHADGLIQIDGGSFDIISSEGIEATYIKINDGEIIINASDDGINAANKSNNYKTTIEINGGSITIKMGQGDTDGIDSNGNIYINGGTVNITANSPFDYDGEAKYNGGTLIVNGEKTTTITNQMMGGGMMARGNIQQDDNMPNNNVNNQGREARGGMQGRRQQQQ